MLRPFLFFLLLVACGSLKPNKIDPSLSVDQLVSAVPMTGEGRGRVGIQGQQYVFAYDALLKENSDWLLSATIPLHGEELMVFPNLKEENPSAVEESFERRIQAMLGQETRSKTSGAKLIQELRQLVRFMLSAKLNIERSCDRAEDGYRCSLEESQGDYSVTEFAGKKIVIQKELSPAEHIEVEGESFQDGRFMRTNFSVVTSGEKIFSLELIWKQ